MQPRWKPLVVLLGLLLTSVPCLFLIGLGLVLVEIDMEDAWPVLLFVLVIWSGLLFAFLYYHKDRPDGLGRLVAPVLEIGSVRSALTVVGIFFGVLLGIVLGLSLLAVLVFVLAQLKMAPGLPLAMIVVLFYGWMVYAFLRYRQGRQDEFLHFLAATVEAQAPLAPAVDAYLRDRPQGPLRELFVMGLMLFVVPGYYWVWHQRHTFDRRIGQLAELLREGYSLPEALGAVPGVASRETIMLAALGQRTDQLALCLRHTSQSRYAALWLETLPRLLYPLALLLFMTAILFFWMTFIFPRMQRIFREFDAEMPALTRWLADSWDVVSDHRALVGLGFLAALALLSLLIGSVTARWYCPGLGRLYRRHIQGQVLRLLGLLLDAGKTVPEALGLLADSGYFAGIVRHRLQAARGRVEQGEPLAASLRRSGLVPATIVPLVQAAEGIRNLPWALAELGEHLGNRTLRAVGRISLFVSPVTVLAVGIVVGCMVIGMFLPLVELIERLIE